MDPNVPLNIIFDTVYYIGKLEGGREDTFNDHYSLKWVYLILKVILKFEYQS